jgi:hypothetical protein
MGPQHGTSFMSPLWRLKFEVATRFLENFTSMKPRYGRQNVHPLLIEYRSVGELG